MKTVKVYLIENRDVFVVCPHCSSDKSIDLSKMLSQVKFQNIIMFNCTCGNQFSIFLERRKFYRKPTNITGICFSAADPEGVVINILDISMSGICFVKNGGKELVKDETVRLQFRLGEPKDAVVSLVSTINVRASKIGAQFINLDEYARKKIGFFLLP